MKRKLRTMCLAAVLLVTTACSGKQPAKSTAKNQTKSLDATYIATEHTDTGIEKWSFTKKGVLQMINQYSYTKEQKENGMLISMQNLESGVQPFDCMVKKQDGNYIFTQVQSGTEIQASSTQFELESGEDGLADTEPFEGSYTNKGYGVTYHFYKDGRLDMCTTSAYTILDGTLTISTASGSAGIQSR